jgi:hypothetical protein
MNKALLRTCFALTCLSVYRGPAVTQEVPFLRNNSILDSLQSITESTIPSKKLH